MALNFHPDRTDPRGLQKNQRALELLLDLLFDAGGAVVLSHADLADLTAGDPHTQYVILAGRAGGQTVLQGLTLEGGVVVNDLGADVNFRAEGVGAPNALFVDGATGRVGIWTGNPQETLDINRGSGVPNGVFSPGNGVLRVADESTNTELIAACASNTAAQAPIFYFVRAGGTLATPTATPALARLGQFVARAFDGSGGQNPASFYFEVDGTVAAGSVPTAIVFETGSAAGTRATRFRLTSAGNAALFGVGSFGGGVGVLSLANATTAPTTNPADGVILYSGDVSGSARLKMRDEAGLAPTVGGVIFTQTAAQTVTNTTTETSIFGAGVGSLTLPANSLTVGRTFKVRIGGTYSTPGLGSPSLTVRVKIGSTVIASGTTSAISLGASGLRFAGELVVTCRSVGATGSVIVDGGINYNIAGSGQPVSDPLNNGGAATTVNTTVSGAFDITVQWDAATTTRIATSTVAVVEVLN